MTCPICYWDDDYVQLKFPDDDVGGNHVSLKQAQQNFSMLGASDPEYLPDVRKPVRADVRDPEWFPIPDEMIDKLPPTQFVHHHPTDRTHLYYWKKDYFST